MLLISGVPDEYDLSSLELITYGTEPMPPSTLEILNRVFPKVRLKQTYGLSELGIMPTCSLDSQSLWMKVGGGDCETKVNGGTLWVRTRTAMLGYLNAPSPFDADGWYDTGDVVESKGDYLRIVGRLSERINVGGEKVDPAEVENVLLQMDNIADATVSGRPNPLTGSVVVATVRLHAPEDKDHLEGRLLEFCRERLAEHKIPVLVQISDREQHNARFKKVRVSAPGVAAESRPAR
jgi:acyl-coenzyme A synthetase/AMP-(fatty) acid ligase